MLNNVNFEGKVLKKSFYKFNNSDNGRLIMFVVNKTFKEKDGKWVVDKEVFVEINKVTVKSLSDRIKVGDRVIIEGKLDSVEYDGKRKLFISCSKLIHIPKQNFKNFENSENAHPERDYEVVEETLF